MGLTDLWYSLVWIFSTRRPPVESGFRIAGVHRRSLLIFQTSAVGLLDPFAMCGAFLRSDYYGSSAPSLGLGSATDLPTSGLAARGEGDPGMVPTFTS